MLQKDEREFLTWLGELCYRYNKSAIKILAIFPYLERVYVGAKLNTSMQALLSGYLNNHVLNHPDILSRLRAMLPHAPGNNEPPLMHSLAKCVYSFNRGTLI